LRFVSLLLRRVRGICLGILAATSVASGPAWAIEYRSVGVDAGILYDAPSTRATKLLILGRGYPVEVLVTLEGWAKVRDAAGELAWIESAQLSAKRTLMIRVQRAQVRSAPDESAQVVFEAEQDVVLDFLDMVGNFAHVRHADGSAGFVRVTQVWGL
jgi:SH3-like domain-containing protein